jgi:hypothetical protein
LDLAKRCYVGLDISRERKFGKASMKKIIAAMVVMAFGWAMTTNAQVFGVAFGRPGISVAVAAPLPSVYVGPGYAPAYVAPAPYYSAPYNPYYNGGYYGGYYPYAYGPSVTIAPYWGWGWGWGGGWHGGNWGGWHGGGWGGWHGGGGGSWHGGGGGHGGHH